MKTCCKIIKMALGRIHPCEHCLMLKHSLCGSTLQMVGKKEVESKGVGCFHLKTQLALRAAMADDDDTSCSFLLNVTYKQYFQKPYLALS